MNIKQIAKVGLTKLGLYEMAAYAFIAKAAAGKGLEFKRDKDDEGNSRLTIKREKQIIFLSMRHLPYALDIVNDFDYYHDAVEPIAKNGHLVVDYSKPAEHKLRPSGVPLFFTSIAESELTTNIYLQKAQLQKGDVVFDLGAYCGGATYSMANQVGPSGHIFAFEPDEENYKALVTNIEKHELTQVTPINKGIWSETTTLEFQAEGNMGSAVSTVLDRKSNIRKIQVLSLADAFRESGAEKLDFIKMDVEGAELQILESSAEFLRLRRPRLVIEPHVVGGVLNKESIEKVLEAMDYQCETIAQSTLRAGFTIDLCFASIIQIKVSSN